MRQRLCVWFPNWPIQRITVAQPELRKRVMVLHAPLEDRSPSVQACSQRAAHRGVRVGMPLAEARVLAPRAWFSVHGPLGNREQLRRLAWTCQRFTPCVGLEKGNSSESLFLDVTGCVSHFGTLRQLCDQIVESFRSQGYRVKLAAAPTLGAAWAIVHSAKGENAVTVLELDDLPKMLSRLPVEALRLPQETVVLLGECGLRTIGQLLTLPRSSLPSRFGRHLLLRLDQALGNAEELLEPELPPEPIRAIDRFEVPLQEAEAIQHLLWRLLNDVMTILSQRHRETQQVLITWQTENGETGEFDVRLLRPTSSPDRFWELLLLHLDRLRIAAGIAVLQAEAIPCQPDAVRRPSLFEDDDSREREFLHLIERLSNRLGEEAVVGYRLLPEAQPELAVAVQPWLEKSRETTGLRSETGAEPGRRLRPLRLLDTPVPVLMVMDAVTGLPGQFRWNCRNNTVALCEGPERVVTGWWRGPMIRRDYYRAETTEGARFWLFHRLDLRAWYLQGVFE